MQEPFDRAAMIEAASRSLRQQMVRSNVRDRPRSKGSLHNDSGQTHSGGLQRGGIGGGHGGSSGGLFSGGTGSSAAPDSGRGSGENAQRRIRSAENQHRLVRTSEAPVGLGHLAGNQPTLLQVASLGPDTPVAGAAPVAGGTSHANANVANEEEHAASEKNAATGNACDLALCDAGLENYNPCDDNLEEGVHSRFQNFQEEIKRPLSRKKDPSASAAAGLGAFAGPARMTDAFEQRKQRQPIPVESWGPRPPSRAGQKATLEDGLDADSKVINQSRGRGDGASSSAGKPSGRVSVTEQVPLNAMVVGGTWASARAEPRVQSETRRGRDRRSSRGNVTEAPNQKLFKSISGVFDNSALASRGSPWQVMAYPGQMGSWASHVDAAAAGALEVSGMGMMSDAAASPWPGNTTESCASPPTRAAKQRHSDGVSVEEVDGETDIVAHGPFRRDATPPQVIVTRSQQGKSRNSVRRGEPRVTRFDTSLDVDFLGLFAS